MAARDPANPDNVAAPAERALSFLSKSFSEAQRNAESDMKLLAAKVQSFKELSTTLDREWASLKNTAVEDFVFLKSLSSSSPSNTLTLEPVRQEWGPNRKQRQRRAVVLNSQGGRKKKVRVSKDWEPLTRMKQSLEDSLKELQNADDGTDQRPGESVETVSPSRRKKNLVSSLILISSVLLALLLFRGCFLYRTNTKVLGGMSWTHGTLDIGRGSMTQ